MIRGVFQNTRMDYFSCRTISSLQEPCKADATSISILQTSKLRTREVVTCSGSHACKCTPKLHLSDSRSVCLTTVLTDYGSVEPPRNLEPPLSSPLDLHLLQQQIRECWGSVMAGCADFFLLQDPLMVSLGLSPFLFFCHHINIFFVPLFILLWMYH